MLSTTQRQPRTTTPEDGLGVQTEPPPPKSVNPNVKKPERWISPKSVILSLLAAAFCVQFGKTQSWNTASSTASDTCQCPKQQEQQPVESSLQCSQKVEYLETFFNARRRAKQSKYNQQPANLERDFFDFWEPDAACLVEERFGSFTKQRHVAFGDGPKFVCGVDYLASQKKQENSCLVYSVGSNNDLKFEKSVQQHLPGCEIHTFDPTILPSKFVGHKVTKFHDWGLGKDGVNVTMPHHRGVFKFVSKSLETIVKELGHTGRTIDIFKIDCEGCEWEVMPKVFDAMARGVLKIDQIQIEVHKSLEANFTHFMESADKAHLRTFHKERNGWGCLGVNCIEYSLASESFLQAVHKHFLC